MVFNVMPYVTQTALAAYIDTTRETISDHVARGTIKKRADAKYDLQECIRAIFKWQSGKLSGRIGNEELATQHVNLARERAESVALKNAVTRGEFVRLETFAKVLERHIMAMREHFLQLPRVAAEALLPILRSEADMAAAEDVIRERTYEAMDVFADGKFLMAEARNERQRRARADDIEEPVG
jgi:phage terminase Nu1 subunit (DNA packaging protein)